MRGKLIDIQRWKDYCLERQERRNFSPLISLLLNSHYINITSHVIICFSASSLIYLS